MPCKKRQGERIQRRAEKREGCCLSYSHIYFYIVPSINYIIVSIFTTRVITFASHLNQCFVYHQNCKNVATWLAPVGLTYIDCLLPYSPNLNPCNYFLWGYLRDRVYQNNPARLDKLEVEILYKMRDISTSIYELVVKFHQSAGMSNRNWVILKKSPKSCYWCGESYITYIITFFLSYKRLYPDLI